MIEIRNVPATPGDATALDITLPDGTVITLGPSAAHTADVPEAGASLSIRAHVPPTAAP